MLVVVRSAPDTTEGKRGVKLARDMAADIVLLQNGVYFMQAAHLDDLGFYGTAYVLSDDRKLRGVAPSGSDRRGKEISYDGLVDLMTENNNVVGMF
ncbi:MAG: DsrH/TusB family sulfur metabolism protein [Thermodesulfovibrionales bacterium]